jgi:hypothetical protein
MKTRTETVIELSDWDDLVTKTYGRPYKFQQQDGCKDRGSHRFTVPDEAEDFANDYVIEKINGPEMGVSFAAWKARDPKAPVGEDGFENYAIELFWARNFYPEFQTLANDLHAKGLLAAGSYTIDIDW